MLRKFGKKPRASKQMGASCLRVAVAARQACLALRLDDASGRVGLRLNSVGPTNVMIALSDCSEGTAASAAGGCRSRLGHLHWNACRSGRRNDVERLAGRLPA